MAKAKFSPAYKKLCALLIAARKAAGLHQVDVAKKLGVHQSFISKVESGERRLDLIEMLWIVDAIGADPIEIVRKVARSEIGLSKR